MLILLKWWKPIAIVLIAVTLLTTAYLKGKAACEAEIIQEKVVVYEKANRVKNDVNKLGDGIALERLREDWQRGGV